MRAGANLPAVGGYNQTVILDAIRRARTGISRVEVAAQTGLSAQTISNVCRRLLEAGLIRETGTQVAGVGKPRTMMQLQPTGRFAAGIHLDPSMITVVVLDLAGTVVAHRAIPTREHVPSSETIENIARAVREVSDAAGVPFDRVMGAGIAAPGPVDVSSGTVLNPPLLAGWENVPVREALAEKLGMPVLLEKDVTAAAVAELWMRTGVEHSNMIFFYYGTGVGAGLVVQNEAIRGLSSNAGDIGSMIVGGGTAGPDDRRWRLGDAVIPRFLVHDAIEHGLLPDPGVQLGTTLVYSLFLQVADAARHGDAVAVDILGTVADHISVALISLINLLDVDLVVFGGPFWAPVAGFLLERVPTLVLSSPLLVPPHPIDFITSSIGDDVAAVGAACLVLDHAFSPRPAGLLIQRSE